MDTMPLVSQTNRTPHNRHLRENTVRPTDALTSDVESDVTAPGDVRDGCCFQGRYFWDALKAIVARQLFFCHALIAMWRLAAISGNSSFWYLTLNFLFMLVESLVILVWKRGQEWKWFQPSVLCYLVCAVPPIWVLELDSLAFIDLRQGVDNVVNPRRYEFFAWIQFDKRSWLLALEQSLLVLIIINRWIIPKGSLSRDELSQLLLTHLGTACDIVDFFSILSDPGNRDRKSFCYIVLSIWTLSILQFCFVSTATRDVTHDEVSDDDDDDDANKDGDVDKQNDPPSKQLHRRIKIDDCAVAVPIATGSDADRKRKLRRGHVGRVGACVAWIRAGLVLLLQTDAWSTILSLLMQDLPFFVIRFTTIVVFRVLTYTNCFFAAKNMLVLILQCYRVYSVTVEHVARQAERQQARRDMWLVKVQFLDYPDPQRWKRDPSAYTNKYYFKF